MNQDDKSTLVFAAIVCLVASLLLAGVATALKGKQTSNRENFRKANVLKAFGVATESEDGTKITPEEIQGYFEKNIVEIFLETKELDDENAAPKFIASGAPAQVASPLTYSERKLVADKKILPTYLWYDGGKPDVEPNTIPGAPADMLVIPISGGGLWSTVYGYLGLQGDIATIKAISFYDHGETPGLGAECVEPWFTSQFEDKILWTDGDGIVDFEVRKSVAPADVADAPSVVAGISAATITANGIQDFLVGDMKRYEPFFATRRSADAAKEVSAVAPVSAESLSPQPVEAR